MGKGTIIQRFVLDSTLRQGDTTVIIIAIKCQPFSALEECDFELELRHATESERERQKETLESKIKEENTA